MWGKDKYIQNWGLKWTLSFCQSRKIWTILILFCIDAQKFKEAFEAARTFNQLLKDGKTEDLVYAEAIEDIEERVEDNPDENKTAGGEEGAGEDDEWACQADWVTRTDTRVSLWEHWLSLAYYEAHKYK